MLIWQKSHLPHSLLIHPSAPSIPFLWKVLGHRFSSGVCSELASPATH